MALCPWWIFILAPVFCQMPMDCGSFDVGVKKHFMTLIDSMLSQIAFHVVCEWDGGMEFCYHHRPLSSNCSFIITGQGKQIVRSFALRIERKTDQWTTPEPWPCPCFDLMFSIVLNGSHSTSIMFHLCLVFPGKKTLIHCRKFDCIHLNKYVIFSGSVINYQMHIIASRPFEI